MRFDRIWNEDRRSISLLVFSERGAMSLVEKLGSYQKNRFSRLPAKHLMEKSMSRRTVAIYAYV